MICGKVIYPSRTEASRAVKGANRSRKPGERPNQFNTTYFCDACQGWHIARKCVRKQSKYKTVEFHDMAQQEHNNKMKDRKTLLIRNYSSQPIR